MFLAIQSCLQSFLESGPAKDRRVRELDGPCEDNGFRGGQNINVDIDILQGHQCTTITRMSLQTKKRRTPHGPPTSTIVLSQHILVHYILFLSAIVCRLQA